MDIIIEHKPQNEATITLKVVEEDYQKGYNKKIKEYAQKVSLKGFRKGKVPPALVKKMYGTSILFEEVNELVSQKLIDYLKENNIKTIGQPLPSEDMAQQSFETQTEFEFVYELGLEPDFDAQVSADDKVTRYTIELSESDLDKYIDKFKKDMGGNQPVDQATEGDIVKGKLTQGDFESETMLHLDYLLDAGKELFKGAKANDVVKFDLHTTIAKAELPHVLNLKREDALAKDGEFSFEVTEVLRFKEAEVNQEMFDKVLGDEGKATTEKAFRKELKKLFEDLHVANTENFLNTQVKELLVKKYTLDLPEAFLKRWIMSNQGEKGATLEEVEREFPLYAREVTWQLFKSKIAEKHQVEVNEADAEKQLEAKIRQQFSQMGLPDTYLTENLPGILENLKTAEEGKHYREAFEAAYEDKIIKTVKGIMGVEEQKVSLDEFEKITKEVSEKAKAEREALLGNKKPEQA